MNGKSPVSPQNSPDSPASLRSRHRRVKSDSDSKTRHKLLTGETSSDLDEEDYQAVLESLRRASGVADVLPAEPTEDIPALEQPSHAVRDSMLHSHSGFNNYRGLYNLALIALFVSTARIAADNISKYGVLIRPSAILDAFRMRGTALNMGLLFSLSIYALVALGIEKLAAAGRLGPQTTFFLHVVNIALSVLTPTAFILVEHPVPLLSFVVMIEAAIVMMKLVSYVAVNQHYRLYRKKARSTGYGEKRQLQQQQNSHKEPDTLVAEAKAVAEGNIADVKPVRYPHNLTLSNMAYFLAAPTLCYELTFPRNKYIRWRFLMRRGFECVFLTAVIAGIYQQWIFPTVKNSFKDGNNLPLSALIDRTLKLSIPNNVLSLALFYSYFHSYLNFMGELLRFGDRQFYRDWWNATTISYFWKNWNVPVHKWAVRHVYRPLLEQGCTKATAQITVFLISAILHEMLVSVPLGMFRMWSFLAMVAQVPLAVISERYLKGTQYGNVLVWASLFFGQPAAAMVYVQAYLAQPGHHLL